MKKKLFVAMTLFAVTITCFGQQETTWEKWSWLMGEWIGEGDGQPGQGGGTFSFSFELDYKVILRKSHSEYPASESNPEVIHDDLMIIYLDNNTNPTRAVYFDNEGHTIHYSITYADNSITLTSGKEENAPVFRLVYTLLEPGTVNTKFEMSQDGENFMTYIEGQSKKTK